MSVTQITCLENCALPLQCTHSQECDKMLLLFLLPLHPLCYTSVSHSSSTTKKSVLGASRPPQQKWALQAVFFFQCFWHVQNLFLNTINSSKLLMFYMVLVVSHNCNCALFIVGSLQKEPLKTKVQHSATYYMEYWHILRVLKCCQPGTVHIFLWK